MVAETSEEVALLSHGKAHGGAVTLLEGFYTVREDCLLLPSNLREGGARRVCAAFERAALAHRDATQRRREFRLLKSLPEVEGVGEGAKRRGRGSSPSNPSES